MEYNFDDLIDVLIESTKSNKLSWADADIYKKRFRDKFDDIEEVYSTSYGLNTEILILKHARYVILEGEGQGYKESVTLILFNKEGDKVVIDINESDIEQPHRLWTLFKLVTRNVSGADKLISDIIKSLDPNRLPF